MTDKEIIDGVDVSECEDNYRICVNTQEPEVICKKYKFCSKNPNCYFKQLARLNAQYNAVVEQNKNLQTKLKGKEQELSEIEKIIEPYQEPIERDALSLPNAIESILSRKTQECEELEKELRFAQEQYNFVRIHREIINAERIDYEHALKKIKEIAYRLRTKRDYNSPDEVNADIDSILQKCEAVQNGQ